MTFKYSKLFFGVVFDRLHAACRLQIKGLHAVFHVNRSFSSFFLITSAGLPMPPTTLKKEKDTSGFQMRNGSAQGLFVFIFNFHVCTHGEPCNAGGW